MLIDSKFIHMKIVELELLTDDISGTEAFYEKVLGLTPYHKDDKTYLFYKIGFTKLIFKKTEEAVAPVYHYAIDVPNNLFKASHQYITENAQTIPVTENSDIADFSNWEAESFYFYDNNGNILEFITRYANQTYKAPPFTKDSYIAVSEIGIVTKNVPDLADRLHEKYGVPFFHRQPRGNKFTVMGDDEGLLIISKRGRAWYPTHDKEANSFFTRLVCLHKGNTLHFAFE